MNWFTKSPKCQLDRRALVIALQLFKDEIGAQLRHKK